MSSIIYVRIPQELKERMGRVGNVNWSKLIRKFIEETISHLGAEELLRRIEKDLEDVPVLPVGTVARWLRVDRDSH